MARGAEPFERGELDAETDRCPTKPENAKGSGRRSGADETLPEDRTPPEGFRTFGHGATRSTWTGRGYDGEADNRRTACCIERGGRLWAKDEENNRVLYMNEIRQQNPPPNA